MHTRLHSNLTPFECSSHAGEAASCRQVGRRCPPGKYLGLVSLALLPLALPTPAEGFRNPPIGAFALGRAGGRLAHIDDSSAIAHNPANLLDVAHAEVQLAPTFADLQWEFDSSIAPGQSASTEDTWKLLPNLFAAVPLKDHRMALGLGFTTPYGIASKWDTGSSAFARPTSVLRYQSAFFTELKTINSNPTFALALGDHVQVAAGLDVVWLELTLKQYYPWLLLTGNPLDPDGKARANGDGVGLGANLAVTLNLAERHRLVATYRSPITISYDGRFELDAVPAALGGGRRTSDFESEIRFPTIVAVGYGLQLSKKVRLAVDAEWIQFSNFDELPLDIESPPPGLPPGVPQRWRDTFTIGVGGDWQFAPKWFLRASYQFYQSPIPDSTLSPTLVDADQNVVTFGLGYRSRHHRLDLAYSPVFYNRRNIRNNDTPAYNGDYRVTLNLYTFAYTYSF